MPQHSRCVRHHSLKPLGYEFLIPILQPSETAPGSRMALQPHPRSAIPQSRARGSPLTLAGHQPLGPDDDPSTNEGRGTPHEPTEGLDQDSSCWSDHSLHHHRVGHAEPWCRGVEARSVSIGCPQGPKKESKKEMGHPRSQHFVLASREIESVTRRVGRWGFSKVYPWNGRIQP